MAKDKGKNGKGAARSDDVDDDLDDLDDLDDELPSGSPRDVTRGVLDRIFNSPNFRASAHEEIRKLERENFRLRRRRADDKTRIAELEELTPDDGGRVLSKDEAADYDAFKALNLKPAELKTLVTEHGELKKKDAERSDEELYVDAADALGFQNLALFMRTMQREGLHLEFKEERIRNDESGKLETVHVPMVRPKGDDKAQLESLSDYLDRELGPEFIAAFEAEAADGESDDAADETEVTATGTAGFAQRATRFGAGDAGARRTALAAIGNGNNATQQTGNGGVTMPVTRNARPSSGRSAEAKRQKEAYEEKRNNPAYASL